jgi:hypothetical protein
MIKSRSSTLCCKIVLKGQCNEIFAFVTGVVETADKLPPVSTAPAVPVAKFTAGIVDTGGKFATGVVDTGGAL